MHGPNWESNNEQRNTHAQLATKRLWITSRGRLRKKLPKSEKQRPQEAHRTSRPDGERDSHNEVEVKTPRDRHDIAPLADHDQLEIERKFINFPGSVLADQGQGALVRERPTTKDRQWETRLDVSRGTLDREDDGRPAIASLNSVNPYPRIPQ